jgi:transposase InsO family protein
MKDSLWSVDLFRCESITLKTQWVLVVMDQSSRRIVGFGIHAGDVDGIALCCMFNKAISRLGTPKYLSSDNDPLFQYHRWKANLHILNIEEVKSIPYIPLSHPFVERLIGTIRREYLDHTLFWTASDLERKLGEFQNYYNHHRVHDSLQRNTPVETSRESTIPCADLSNYGWMTFAEDYISCR